MGASRYGRSGIVSLLLDAGATVDAQSKVSFQSITTSPWARGRGAYLSSYTSQRGRYRGVKVVWHYLLGFGLGLGLAFTVSA